MIRAHLTFNVSLQIRTPTSFHCTNKEREREREREMRPTNSNMWRWNSPTPNLFGGLALTLGLITLALIILACSYKKKASNSSSTDEENQKPDKPEISEARLKSKILVVKAGDRNPTDLATLVNSSTTLS